MLSRRRSPEAVLLAMLLAGPLLVFAAHSIFARWEVERLPFRSVDAVLVETDGGEVAPYGYRIVVTRSGWPWLTGTQVASLYVATRSPASPNVRLRWEHPGILRVEYPAAKRKTLHEPKVVVADMVVSTVLVSGVTE